MSDKNLELERIKYDPYKDFIFYISSICIISFFMPATILLLFIFLGKEDAGILVVRMAEFFITTEKQFSLVGSIVSLPVLLLGFYMLYLVSSGKLQSKK